MGCSLSPVWGEGEGRQTIDPEGVTFTADPAGGLTDYGVFLTSCMGEGEGRQTIDPEGVTFTVDPSGGLTDHGVFLRSCMGGRVKGGR